MIIMLRLKHSIKCILVAFTMLFISVTANAQEQIPFGTSKGIIEQGDNENKITEDTIGHCAWKRARAGGFLPPGFLLPSFMP